MLRKKQIGIIGGRQASSFSLELAYKIGSYLAENGFIVICGGKGGIMEYACKGVFEKGGISVGILPDSDIDFANEYVTIPIATGIGVARNSIIAMTNDIIVAFEGSFGTLSEIAYALQFNKKIIAYYSWKEHQISDKIDYFNDFDSFVNIFTKLAGEL